MSMEIGDIVYARKKGRSRGLIGTLVAQDESTFSIQQDGGKSLILSQDQWTLYPNHESPHRFTPVRITPVGRAKVAEHLFRLHGWTADQVQGTDVENLIQMHADEHQVARDSGFTLNHVHGMTPQEEQDLRNGLVHT